MGKKATTTTLTDLTFRTKLYTFVVFNGFFLFLIGVNALLLWGLWQYPFHVGVYMILPYVAYCKVGNTSNNPTEGTRWPAFSKNFFVFVMLREYLGLTIHQPLPKGLVEAEQNKDDDGNVNSQFIIAVFPHGTAADYRVAMDGMLDQIFPTSYHKVRTLGASVLLTIPLVREIFTWTSGIDASRPVAEKALDKGYSLLVLPGGEAEQIRTIYQKERVYLKNRKGFLKLALRKSIPVVPVYVFGASDYYQTSNALLGPRRWMVKNLGICIPFAMGQWGSILCPRPVKTTVVFGGPLSFAIKDPKSPTTEELNAAHQTFCSALMTVFNEHKDRLGYGERTLEVL